MRFQRQERTAAGSHTGRNTRAASRSNRARPVEQEHQPDRPLRSRGTRPATRAEAAAPQHKSSPEESDAEVSEPQHLHQRSVRATRQPRKASKLVQGGGNISDDDCSSSGEELSRGGESCLHLQMLAIYWSCAP